MKDVETIEFKTDGAIAWVALDRPQKHNALNAQLVHELTSTFRFISKLEDVRVVVLTGNGRSFCAGADLSIEKNIASGEAIFDLLLAIDNIPQPVVGRINGAAIGGGMGLVSCCDIVIASENAKFGFSEVKLGLVAAVISPFVLSKIGASRARELFLTGEKFDSQKAVEVGLVHEVVMEEEFDERIDERIQNLLMAAPGAQADAKRLIAEVAHQPVENMRGFTMALFKKRWESEEGQEGIRAFREMRKPKWQN